MKHLEHQNRKEDVYDGDMWHVILLVNARVSFGNQSGMASGHYGMVVAQLWNDLWVMWGIFGDMQVPLDHLGSLWAYFGPTLGALWGHF